MSLRRIQLNSCTQRLLEYLHFEADLELERNGMAVNEVPEESVFVKHAGIKKRQDANKRRTHKIDARHKHSHKDGNGVDDVVE